ncbi:MULTISPECIES: hypothetical protein [Streptosporangium]|uniref:CopG family transcriptional regulator n=1 Tax=Streptosporangium brasiliense TaxID=47480 RepID=A0ABT9RNQ7_9ACTN|nr:hypothetical protein [Streptosporangium brasiliense]MDP9870471.1 hypothetical protein [Streptosporangium brasiliense]
MVRVKPYKATFDLSPKLLREVRVWAAQHGLVGVAPVVRALIAELVADAALQAVVGDALADTGPQVPRGSVVKTTYDLDPPLYRDLKTWAATHDTTGAAVLRALLATLVADWDGGLAVRIAARS